MITATGKSLSVLIVSETSKDWQTFATWYSVFKNLPYAQIAIVCHRTKETPFAYFQWTKRLKVPVLRCWPFSPEDEKLNWLNAIKLAKSKLASNILVMRPLTMVLDALDQKTLDRFNGGEPYVGNDIWFMPDPDIDRRIDDYVLGDDKLVESAEPIYVEAKETNSLACLVSYKKGCGRWIDTSTGCPFSSAGGLVSTEMTANEIKINELWQQMVPLYNAVI